MKNSAALSTVYMLASMKPLCVCMYVQCVRISDYSNDDLLVQGRLFLSARIVGFYSNLFGHKTKFFFLWEDIEDIQVLPPSLSSVGSPLLAIVLKKDRGIDARHGAKCQDDEGRLKFHFQSFVSSNSASR